MQNIFVYGTLQSELIINKLTGKTFQALPAILKGYKRYCVKGCDYPAIVTVADSETKGLVLMNVEDSDVEILSFYEGDEYEKKEVAVLIDNNPTEVLSFVWTNSYDLLEDKEWELHHFQKYCQEHYLDKVIPETLEEFYKG